MPTTIAAVSAAVALYAEGAAAHNAAHAAVAILGADAQGVSIVRLTHGLAYRNDDGFRFVCPEVWGGDIAAPSSAIPGGPAVVAAEQLYLVEPSGRISVHPSHEGAGIALARDRDALFGLFRREGHVELRRVTRNASELIHAFEEPFSALAASDSGLSLLRSSEGQVTVQRLSLDGALRERLTWSEPSKIADAELHSSDNALYVTIVHSASPWVTLGRIEGEIYEQLRSANSSFAGPVALESAALVARDGTLEPLTGARALAPGTFIECLDAFSGLQYACVGDGLMEVSADGLGEPLFDITSLREPDYVGLSETQREACGTRWRDLRDHLLLEGRFSAQPREVEEQGDDARSKSDEMTAPASSSTCALHDAPRRADGSSARLLFLALLGLYVARRKRYSASEL